MSDLERRALLPAGLSDVLPPDAAFEAEMVEKLIASFARHGYARVKAPLVEFEDGLLSGAGAAMAADTFRLMDPVSQRMMGVRADITPQIARIAATRLKNAPRPLRLSYAGEVLRVKGTQLRPERQIGQVGVELIGAETPQSDAEMVLMAVEALSQLGVPRMSVDLTVPLLVPSLVGTLDLTDETRSALITALDRKDAAAVARLGATHAKLLSALLAAAGEADTALAALAKLHLPHAAAVERARLGEVAALIRAEAPDLVLTVDPVENRGFAYHTGISFTIFSPGVRGELGSGGRYVAVNGTIESAGPRGEPATGFTLYVDTILRVLPAATRGPCVFVPLGHAGEVARQLRQQGWTTLAGLAKVDDVIAEAHRLGCTHVYLEERVVELPPK
jgi:ATP phosphoribosyltransferase regulatory subunit